MRASTSSSRPPATNSPPSGSSTNRYSNRKGVDGMTVTKQAAHKVYLNGQWVAGGPELEVINPADGKVFASVGTVNREQVQAALETAHKAFSTWRALTAKERGALLHKVADELKRRQDEIARVITL